MSFKLLLTDSAYPDNFECIHTPENVLDYEKQQWVEDKILNAINNKNHKLNIKEIEYCNIQSRFSKFINSNYAGLIVEEICIKPQSRDYYAHRGYFVFKKDGQVFAQIPWIYAMISGPAVGGRNVFISQSIFPALTGYMQTYIISPSYTITNHSVYFINIVNNHIEASSIIKDVYALRLLDISYIDVFNSTPSVGSEMLTLKEYVLKFDISNYNELNDVYSCDDYYIDFRHKKFSIRTNTLLVGQALVAKEATLDFNGSSEKFYWMSMLPAVIKAIYERYSVDYTALENFCNTRDKFSPTSKKMARFVTILDYIKKLIMEG